jgi:hypothetical protein
MRMDAPTLDSLPAPAHQHGIPHMKSLVSQRFRTRRVPAWVTACTHSLHPDFFNDDCLHVARHREAVSMLDVGASLMSQLRSILPLSLLDKAVLDRVGVLSPAVLAEIASGHPEGVTADRRALPAALASVRNCGARQRSNGQRAVAQQALLEGAIKRLGVDWREVPNRLRP